MKNSMDPRGSACRVTTVLEMQLFYQEVVVVVETTFLTEARIFLFPFVSAKI